MYIIVLFKARPVVICILFQRSLLAHDCRSLSRFLYHEATRNIAIPPGWDVSPSQVTSQHFVRFSSTVCWYQFILQGGERHCECKVSCPRTQTGQGSNPDLSIRSPARLPVGHRVSHKSEDAGLTLFRPGFFLLPRTGGAP